MILAGDVGGTKTELALFSPGAEPRRPLHEKRALSHDYASLEALVGEFLKATDLAPTRAVFGVAGPVVDNRCETTNLPWTMDGDAIGKELGVKVTLLNDLETTAWGLATLESSDLLALKSGSSQGGSRALIAAGTGLGEGILWWNGQSWVPSPSEGGHCDFAPRDPIEDELLTWLRAKYGRVSYERILSGPGLADLYRFMSDTGRGAEPAQVRERFATALDPAAVVSETALDGSCERSILTLRKFTEIYGAEAGNLALKALAVGGVFVGGGIAPRILPFLRNGRFVNAFTLKGRLTPVLEKIAAFVILDPKTALWGAAAYAMTHA